MNSASQTRSLHEAATRWYAANARDLPWRRTRDPYAILVSEVMLQQTQVERAIPKYHQFLETFPSIEALAASAAGDVIRIWSGMGYNGRAVRLHQLAVRVANDYGGQLPVTPEELRKLPGIGPYTAAAVACFAFGASVPVTDTNIYRVLSRVLHGVRAPERPELAPVAAAMVPGKDAPLDAATWHQALMDIGATVCTAARPKCILCPFRKQCAAAPHLQGGAARSLAEASIPYVPKQGRFTGSTRYYRGRIVEALRDLANGRTMSLDELSGLVDDGGGPRQDRKWVEDLVEGLARDGLVVRLGDEVRLP